MSIWQTGKPHHSTCWSCGASDCCEWRPQPPYGQPVTYSCQRSIPPLTLFRCLLSPTRFRATHTFTLVFSEMPTCMCWQTDVLIHRWTHTCLRRRSANARQAEAARRAEHMSVCAHRLEVFGIMYGRCSDIWQPLGTSHLYQVCWHYFIYFSWIRNNFFH